MPSARRGSNFCCRAPLLRRERAPSYRTPLRHPCTSSPSIADILCCHLPHLVLRQEIGSVLNLPTHDRMFAASLHAQPHFQPVFCHFLLLLNCLDSSLTHGFLRTCQPPAWLRFPVASKDRSVKGAVSGRKDGKIRGSKHRADHHTMWRLQAKACCSIKHLTKRRESLGGQRMAGPPNLPCSGCRAFVLDETKRFQHVTLQGCVSSRGRHQNQFPQAATNPKQDGRPNGDWRR